MLIHFRSTLIRSVPWDTFLVFEFFSFLFKKQQHSNSIQKPRKMAICIGKTMNTGKASYCRKLMPHTPRATSELSFKYKVPTNGRTARHKQDTAKHTEGETERHYYGFKNTFLYFFVPCGKLGSPYPGKANSRKSSATHFSFC